MIISILAFIAALAVFVGVCCFVIFVIGEDSGLGAAIGMFIVVPLGIIGLWALYDELFHDHPVYTLDKREWACTVSHREQSTTYVYSGGAHGGVAMPITTTATVCDRYEKKA